MKKGLLLFLVISLYGCSEHYFLHYSKITDSISWYYHYEFYLHNEKCEFFGDEPPRWNYLSYNKSSYKPPIFFKEEKDDADSTFISDYDVFEWDLSGGLLDKYDTHPEKIRLVLPTSTLESGKVYTSPPGINPNKCSFVAIRNNGWKYHWDYSFTKVNDDIIAYSLSLFAQDSLTQPQMIKIDFSKKLMAIDNVSSNFKAYVY